jgi:hypothetical protein
VQFSILLALFKTNGKLQRQELHETGVILSKSVQRIEDSSARSV